jgi:hypothetical protein
MDFELKFGPLPLGSPKSLIKENSQFRACGIQPLEQTKGWLLEDTNTTSKFFETQYIFNRINPIKKSKVWQPEAALWKSQSFAIRSWIYVETNSLLTNMHFINSQAQLSRKISQSCTVMIMYSTQTKLGEIISLEIYSWWKH